MARKWEKIKKPGILFLIPIFLSLLPECMYMKELNQRLSAELWEKLQYSNFQIFSVTLNTNFSWEMKKICATS